MEPGVDSRHLKRRRGSTIAGKESSSSRARAPFLPGGVRLRLTWLLCAGAHPPAYAPIRIKQEIRALLDRFRAAFRNPPTGPFFLEALRSLRWEKGDCYFHPVGEPQKPFLFFVVCACVLVSGFCSSFPFPEPAALLRALSARGEEQPRVPSPRSLGPRTHGDAGRSLRRRSTVNPSPPSPIP